MPDILFPNPNLKRRKIRMNATEQVIYRKIGDRLHESGQLELKPDYYEVVEGLTMQQVRGHSATMQTVKLQRGGETLYGFADLIPTTAHLSLPWIMGYDLFPTETLEAKRNFARTSS